MTDEQFDALTEVDAYESEYVSVNRTKYVVGFIEDFLREAETDGSEITLSDFLKNVKETYNG